MKYYSLLLVIIVSLIASCSDKKEQENTFAIDGQSEEGFETGTYCADISYYNPGTGTRSNYTLQVEVEDNKVEKILFNNGGWMDSDHMTPQELDDDGECNIVSDKGSEYGIKIRDRKCASYSTVSFDEPAMTLMDCAKQLEMTYEEIEYYKKRFNEEENEEYTPEKCELLGNYIQKIRKLKAEKEAYDNMFENGFIHYVYTRTNGDYFRCQAVVAKKYGTFFWLDVLNNEKCEGGILEFDPSTSGYQEVIVREVPENGISKRFRMKIMMIDESLEVLKTLIEKSCGD